MSGQGRSYFELSEQLKEGYMSPRLQEFCAYYSNRLSYKEVEKLVERVTGEQLLSDQKIWQIVSDKALIVSQDIMSNVNYSVQ
jgi:reverse gyrase